MEYSRSLREYRSWLLFLVALVPTAAVLIGAAWIWNDRTDSIHLAESELQSAEVTVELFALVSHVLTTDGSFRASALPDAGPDVIEAATIDAGLATQRIGQGRDGIEGAVAILDPTLDGTELARQQRNASLLLVSTLEAIAEHEPGTEQTPQLEVAVGIARNVGAGHFVPIVLEDSPEITIHYSVMASTIAYHRRLDAARTALLQDLEGTPTDSAINDLSWPVDSGDAWLDLLGDRQFAEEFGNNSWQIATGIRRDDAWTELLGQRAAAEMDKTGLTDGSETAAGEEVRDNNWQTANDRPGLGDSSEPLADLIDEFREAAAAGTLTTASRDRLLLEVRQLDLAIQADVQQAWTLFHEAMDEHLKDLRRSRQGGLLAGMAMAICSATLAGLTVAEIRHRREAERGHAEALALLEEKADRDPTTGAWNRRRLERTLPTMLEDANNVGHTVLLAYLDLDSFKAVNDVWGHAVGDLVLRTVHERLCNFYHDDVQFELCRFGGDEFVLFACTEPRSIDWLEELGRTMLGLVNADMWIDGRLHKIGASAGIAASTGESSMASLLLEADSSLIMAKGDRRTAVVYDRSKSRTGELVHALPDALASREVQAHLQPVVDVRRGEIAHVEALARWNRPSGEMVSPGEFIPIVESYGLAEEMTKTMLRSVGQILEQEDTPTDMRVWINVSPRELDVAFFADRFLAVLARFEISPDRIGIEITETSAIRDHDRLALELQKLRRANIVVAIDDFGSGYSPLGYLRQLPVDTVKIDRSLISHIDSDTANQHIVLGIVGLVKELGMEITAEGVERREELRWLFEHGISHMQGYLLGRPGCPAEFDWSRKDLFIDAREPSDIIINLDEHVETLDLV